MIGSARSIDKLVVRSFTTRAKESPTLYFSTLYLGWLRQRLHEVFPRRGDASHPAAQCSNPGSA